MTAKTLVVGIGSPHGDDQAGWRVIESLRTFSELAVDLRIAAVPHDLLDWLAGRDELHIIDSLAGVSEPWAGVCGQWRMERDTFGAIHFRSACGCDFLETQDRIASSHGIALLETLALASTLQLLPDRVHLWVIPGFDYRPQAALSSDCLQIALEASAKLRGELAPNGQSESTARC